MVERMLIDAPGIEDGEKKPEDVDITLTDDNADEVLKILNSFN